MTARQPERAKSEILWSRRARNDLKAIGDYIAKDNPAAAHQWVDKLIATVERAGEMPFSGRRVPELPERQEIREVLLRNYRIVYRVGDVAIEVLTVFEGHRLFRAAAVIDEE